MTAALLSSLQIFSEVETREALSLLADTPRVRVAAGEVLLRPEVPNSTLYVIVSGVVQVHLSQAEGAEPIHLGEGDCVGEMSVIDDSPVCALVRAEQDCELLALDRRTAWRLIEAHPPFARNLLRVLARRLRHGNLRIVEEQRLREKYQRYALHDELTGLYNRRWLDLALTDQVAAYRRDGQPFSLIMIDLDHFKDLNDSHGHQAGDRCLGRVAQTIRANLRPLDQAARFGGEEFAVILPDTQTQEALAAAERLRRAAANLARGDEPSVTISLGVAQIGPGDDPESVIQAADQALYRAKQAGRNRVEC